MCMEELTEIYIHLKDVLKNVSESPVDTTFYTEGITKDMNTLRAILEQNTIDDQSTALLSKINITATSITEILNQRFNLRSKFFTEVREVTDSQADVVSNITLSKEDISGDYTEQTTLISTPPTSSPPTSANNKSSNSNTVECSMKKRRKSTRTKLSKRLPAETVSILNDWYNENMNNPYLSKEDLEELVSKTKLQETQIKNWASNRRRKRNDYTVSDEYTQILNGTSS